MDRHYRHRDNISRTRSRSRSRSPDRSEKQKSHHRHRHHHHHHHDHHRHHDRGSHHDRHRHDHKRHKQSKSAEAPVAAPVTLPFNAQELSKVDLTFFKPLLAMYLDIQKGLLFEGLNEEEIKGRWKSFVARWNRGELAEGWYDPETLKKARKSVEEEGHYFIMPRELPSSEYDHGFEDEDSREGKQAKTSNNRLRQDEEGEEEEEEEGDYGPDLPTTQSQHYSGPTIPNLQDLELKKEGEAEDAISAREQSKLYHRAAVHAHRNEVKEMQDSVAPRAEPGTHERRLEKRREKAASNRDFAESSRRGDSPEGAPDEELMGSGENGLEAFKKTQDREKRRKNDREIRREEILRARAAEREERIKKYRQKEDETIGWLKTLARQRFG